MADIERLKRLAAAGDRDAAEQLQSIAKRRQDPGQMLIAASALNNSAEIARTLDRVWNDGDWEQVERFSRALGFVITLEIAQAFDDRLKTVQKRQQSRLLPRQRIFRALYEARLAPHAYTFLHGGGGNSRQRTTLCLIARTSSDDALVVSFAQI